MEIRWDDWSLVDDCIKGSGDVQLVAVCFAQPWNPPSLHVACTMESLRMSGALGQVAQLFIVDGDKEQTAAWELGVVATPAIVVYANGEPMQVRRSDRTDDIKIVGDQIGSEESLASMLRMARDNAKSGKKILILD